MRLYVNIDHVATVREARRTDEPGPVRAAILAELAGADGITAHLRQDRRHVNDHDIERLHETVRTGLNLELSTEAEMVAIGCRLAPFQVTLVPERREEVTTEGGLDLSREGVRERVAEAVERLQGEGIRVSLFVDPTREAMTRSAELGVEAIEIHTGEYANASRSGRAGELARLHDAARAGREVGLAVHAGHGLTYENVVPVAALPESEEVNIGHSIVSRSVLVGIDRAVRGMREILRDAPGRVGEPGVWVPPQGF